MHSKNSLSGGRYYSQVFEGLTVLNDSIVSSTFRECRFIGSSFIETNFQNCRFIQCEFSGCDLSLAHFDSCVFSGVRFEKSRLIGIDWTRVDWNTSNLRRLVKFYKCNISHCTFIGLKFDGINIIDCMAHDVDFREADLLQGNFDGTDLSESLFFNTNLSKADFTGARNYAISPEKNTLKGAKFSQPEAMSLLFNLDIVLMDDKKHDSVGGEDK